MVVVLGYDVVVCRSQFVDRSSPSLQTPISLVMLSSWTLDFLLLVMLMLKLIVLYCLWFSCFQIAVDCSQNQALTQN
jgi:hypothetical protein